MNRNNIWIHIGIAVVIVTLAAVMGQIRRWETSLRTTLPATSGSRVLPPKLRIEKRERPRSEPEVLVRFKPGVTVDEIKRIAARNNDLMEDEIEAVKGLVSIDDLDDRNAEVTAGQYAAMSDVVEYAQPNYEIELDPEESDSPK